MNQIFRVIWNHATQSWVAVSELTKAHKKQSRNSLKAVLGGALVLLSINTAEAAAVGIESTNGATIVPGDTKTGPDGVSIGVGTDTSAGANNVAIGKNAKVGNDAKGRTQPSGQSVAIGGGNLPHEGARALGQQSVAIGGNTIAEGNSSIAIGNDDVDAAVTVSTTYTNSDGNTVRGTIGEAYTNLTGKNLHTDGGRYKDTKSGEAAVAIGVKAQAGDISVALGTGAAAEKVNAVALGSGASATFDNSVALGGGSTTDKEGTKQTSVTVNGHTYNWSGGSTTSKGDVVSIGKAGYERQLKNVAAGEVSETSTDGINGSQLYGILNNMTIDPTFLYAGDDANKGEVTGADADAKKADAKTKKIVVRSMKDGRLNLLGGATGELSDNNIGVNYDNENTIKFKLAKALTGLTSTDVGGIVTNAGGINMNNKSITNLAAGTNSTDAVNKSQLDKVATNNIKLGGDSGTTDAQQLDKTGGLQFNVKGTNGLTTTASGTDVTVKLDDATKAAVDSIANKIENNKIKLSATNDSTSTDQQDLNKSGGIEFKVKGDNGLTASASGDTVTLKLDDATKAKVDSVDSKIGDNNISLGSDSGSTDAQALTNTGGMKFNIKGENGLTTTASGKDVTVKLDDTTKDKIDNAADKDLSNITPAGKKQIKDQVTWKAKANNSGIALTEDTVDDNDTAETIGADGTLTLDAGKNLRLQRKGKVFTYGLESNLTGINSITGLANTLPVTKNDAAAPTTNQAAPTKVDGTKAASVNDILNAGWNLQNNGEAKDFVKPYDTVNFVDGKGTKAVVETTPNGTTSKVKFDIDTVDMTSNPNGTVKNPMGDNVKQLLDDLAAAKKAVADNPDDEAAKAKLKDAEDAVNKAGGNKIATAQNVANMINNSGFTLKADKTDGQNETSDETLKKDGELIKPGSTVTMKAGKNMTVKHEANGNITYATASNVTFDSVQFGENGPKITNKDGNINVGDKDGKPTQITGVASSLKTTPVETTPNGKDGAKPESKPNLIDLANATTPNAAATVGDLQNMGWVVGAPENGYVDTVKNANKVDFKGKNGISVTGKTNKEGVREITISVAEGKVTNDVTVTKADGKVIDAVKGPDGKLYKKGPDGKPDTSEEITLAEGDKVNNEGSKFVSGNAVATAIQESGWNIGKADAKDVTKAFEKEAKVHDKVNPNDDVKFVDGQNTVVKMVTVDAKNEDGSKKATTFVKVDVTGLPVQYTDKNGTPVTKVGDKYFTVDDKGNPTTTEVAPADLTTNMVNPAAAPNEIGAPTTLGNVKSNLPSVNDADKNAKDVDGNPIAGKDNKSAPIDAAKAADIAKNAGNNAATVSDVLNAGWNLQNNGKDKDFVKPYDTVNFVDGKGTKAVVKTEEDGTTSNVKFDIDTGSITNNADGSVQGPVVTPEMTKALEDATNTLNNLPANAPASVRKAAEQAVADAANNIANVANKVATAQDVANAINKSGFALTTSANGGEKISGTPEMINPGKKVEMVAGKNMTVKQESNGKVTYATASNVTFDSVQFGDNGPKITNNGGNINVGTATGAPTKITGVAPGEISATSKDAVNGSQLHAMGNKLQGQINKLGNRMNAGMATSAAMANLLQPHKPGQSVATAGVGQHKNQSAVAVGYSRISDNGKYGVRFSMGANTQGEVTGGAAVGYFW